ncbi:hypothetical protein [Lichenicoccus sp.]|uniref:hypothetical protein n=1 Tax=Lichenicoccus sp. TaxID=2781899 RepID=UPI003D0BBC3F
MKRAGALAALGLLAGCAAPSRPVTIADALRTLQTQLLEAGALSARAATPAQFARAVRGAQCAANNADPEVPIIAGEITVALTGSFTSNGGFAVGPAITGGPPFGLSGSFARTQGQGLTLPLSFAALSSLPDVVAQSRLALFTELPPHAKAAEIRRALVARDRLRLRVRGLITSFRSAQCRGSNGAVFQPRSALPQGRPLARPALQHGYDNPLDTPAPPS